MHLSSEHHPPMHHYPPGGGILPPAASHTHETHPSVANTAVDMTNFNSGVIVRSMQASPSVLSSSSFSQAEYTASSISLEGLAGSRRVESVPSSLTSVSSVGTALI